jgi:hypothetical protein
MLMVRMQIHMSPATHAALQKRAHEDGVSASELVRQGIELRLRLEQGGEYRIINQQLEPHHAPAPGAPVAAPSHETSEPSPVAAPSNGDA